MAEYIEREALLKELAKDVAVDGNQRASQLLECIINAPAVYVAPVVHGQWIEKQNPRWPAYSHEACSICGWWNTKNALCYEGRKKPGHSLNYCPNCGAKMDGGEEDA